MNTKPINRPVDVLAGVLRNLKTGTYHRGAGNAPSCNHSGSRRIPRCEPAKVIDAERASDASFCRKCFPRGKPDIATIARIGEKAVTSQPLNRPVDVLAVMRRDAGGFEMLHVAHPDRPAKRAQSDAARAAVAELIEAAKACKETELGEMACVGSMAPCEDALGRLFAALANIGPQS